MEIELEKLCTYHVSSRGNFILVKNSGSRVIKKSDLLKIVNVQGTPYEILGIDFANKIPKLSFKPNDTFGLQVST